MEYKSTQPTLIVFALKGQPYYSVGQRPMKHAGNHPHSHSSRLNRERLTIHDKGSR